MRCETLETIVNTLFDSETIVIITSNFKTRLIGSNIDFAEIVDNDFVHIYDDINEEHYYINPNEVEAVKVVNE